MVNSCYLWYYMRLMPWNRETIGVATDRLIAEKSKPAILGRLLQMILGQIDQTGFRHSTLLQKNMAESTDLRLQRAS